VLAPATLIAKVHKEGIAEHAPHGKYPIYEFKVYKKVKN
jgi:hypothetical protein